MTMLNWAGAAAAAAAGGGGGGPAPAGEHRYWRVVVNDYNSAGGYVWLTEIEIRSEPSGAAREGDFDTLTASQQNGTFNFSNAFDDDTGTYYRTSTNSPTYPVYFNFTMPTGETIDIQELIFWPHTGNEDHCPRDFDVQFSDDGISWTTAWSVLDETSANDTTARIHTDPAHAPVPVQDAWDVSNVAVGYDITNDDKTIENTSGGADYQVVVPSALGVPAGSGELLYVELEMASDADTEYDGYIGLFGSNAIPSELSNNPGQLNSIGRRGDGSIWTDAVEVATSLLPFGNDDILMMAFQPNTGELWTGVNGVWDDDPASDPATVTYPRTQGAYTHLAGQGRDTGNGVTLHMGSGDWTYTAPVGAIEWTAQPDINPRGDIGRAFVLTSPIKTDSVNANRQRVYVVIDT